MSKNPDVYVYPNEIGQKVVSGEYSLMKKSGKSGIWKVFSVILDQNGEELKEFLYCRRCEKIQKCHKLSTTNALKHAEKHIKGDDEKLTAKKLEELLTKWIIKDCIPYDLLASENLKAVFKGMVHVGTKFPPDTEVDKLMPKYLAHTKNVSEIYEKCFDTVRADIAAIKEIGFGLTANIWTDTFTEESYIAITIHYLKNDLLTFRLLGLTTLEEEVITDNVASKMLRILKDFDCKLSGKSILVTSSDDNITKSFPDILIIPCISHLLQNALEKSMKEIPEITEIISNCFKLVSILNKLKLTTLLGSLMPAPCMSQWQNIYKMLKAVEGNWTKIKETLQNQNETTIVLTINTQYLKAAVKTFKPFKQAIGALEDDSCATLHLVLVYLHDLKKSCATNDNEFVDFECIERLKKNLYLKLEKIITENITTLHKVALFLYPPANKLLQFSDEEKQCVEKECRRIVKCFENDAKTIVQETDTSTTPASKRLKLFADFVESKGNSDFNKLINEEIRLYKNTHVPNTADFDVFSWWKLQKSNFALLYKLSCTVLATPASGAVAKRLFSTANSLLCQKYKQDISDMEVEKILFLNFNAKDGEI